MSCRSAIPATGAFTRRLFARPAAAAATVRATARGVWPRTAAISAFTCGAVATATVVGGCAVALCKSPDTPQYLIPYYLRTTRARFNHYASIRENGQRFMTAEDFVAAILALPDPELQNAQAAKELAKMFTDADANGDGRLSFREYSLLSILLITPIEDFKLAFGMFDNGTKGGLTKLEFKQLLSTFGDDSMKPPMKSGFIKQLFAGTPQKIDGNDVTLCSWSSLAALIQSLERAVQTAEFRLKDTTGTGVISERAFGELLTTSILGRHLPFFIVDNLRQMSADSKKASGVTLETWHAFNDMLRHSDAIAEALLLFTSNGQGVRQADFARAVKAACGVTPPTQALKLVFNVFDRDGDGTLEYDEFIGVMKAKGTYNVVQDNVERRNIFTQSFYCAAKLALPEADEE